MAPFASLLAHHPMKGVDHPTSDQGCPGNAGSQEREGGLTQTGQVEDQGSDGQQAGQKNDDPTSHVRVPRLSAVRRWVSFALVADAFVALGAGVALVTQCHIFGRQAMGRSAGRAGKVPGIAGGLCPEG